MFIIKHQLRLINISKFYPVMDQSVEQKMKQLIKKQKTIPIDYQCLQLLYQLVKTSQPEIQSIFFGKIFDSIGQQMKHLLLFEEMTYRIWLNNCLPSSLREKTRLFIIIFDWIVKFQMRLGKLDSYKAQFEFLMTFLKQQTKTSFQRMVFLQEIHENLKQLLPILYDKKLLIISQNRPPQLIDVSFTFEEALIIMSFLKQIITQTIVKIGQNKDLYKNIINQATGQLKNYTDFASRCFYLLLSSCESFDLTFQAELTKYTLMFLRQDFPAKYTISFIKALMVKTSKEVRFELLAQYIQFYKFIEAINSDKLILEELNNMIYFRQHVIESKYFQEQQIFQPHLISLQKELTIKACKKQKIYFSRESEQENLFKFELYMQQGDISIKIYFVNNNKQLLQWAVERTANTRFQLVLRYKGLYTLQFDNTYSLKNSKKVVYRTLQLIKITQGKSNK